MAAAILLFLVPANSHESWISEGKYRNLAGEWCCGAQDCEEVADVTEVRGGYRIRLATMVLHEDWLSRDRYRRWSELRHIDEIVPFAEATPSPDGKFWRCKRIDGSRRCFFAPLPLT